MNYLLSTRYKRVGVYHSFDLAARAAMLMAQAKEPLDWSVLSPERWESSHPPSGRRYYITAEKESHMTATKAAKRVQQIHVLVDSIRNLVNEAMDEIHEYADEELKFVVRRMRKSKAALERIRHEVGLPY